MNKLINLKIDTQLLLYLIVAFIFATIIGTLSHEYGHFFAAKSIGLDAKVHYAYVTFSNYNFMEITDFKEILLLLGGPLQTILTGIIGLCLLFANKSKILLLDKLNLKYWIYVFLSLFWLRQTANFVMYLVGFFIRGTFSGRGDEIRLAIFFQIPEWSILFITALLGLIITVYVILKFIPINQRLTFILAGLIGGISGYCIWLESVGQLIMP